MGRGSKEEQSDAVGYQGQTSASSYQYAGDSSPASSRVVTDSESIARDIKEGRLSGFVGHGTALTGDTNFQMMLRVDGHLTGTVTSDGGTLIIGTNGQVDANISVGVANVNGTVNGDIIATDKIHLGRTARVIGNISTPQVVIEEGAVFEGGCKMLKAREDVEKQVAETASQHQYNPSTYSSYSQSSATATADDEDDDDDISASADDDDDDVTKADAAVL
jgi:cytoskeletal protein CcmA (bactofilin family)